MRRRISCGIEEGRGRVCARDTVGLDVSQDDWQEIGLTCNHCTSCAAVNRSYTSSMRNPTFLSSSPTTVSLRVASSTSGISLNAAFSWSSC